MAGYDYRHLSQDFGKVEAESTASFKKTFKSSSSSLSKVLKQYHAVATAKVLTAGIVSLNSTKAVVLLFVNQTVANTTQKTPVDDSQIKVTMVSPVAAGYWTLKVQ